MSGRWRQNHVKGKRRHLTSLVEHCHFTQSLKASLYCGQKYMHSVRIYSQRCHWDVISKFTHTHNRNRLFALLFPTNWDLRRLETETCWRLLASSSCTTSYCQLPDLRPAATGDFVQHKFLLLQEKTSVNKDIKEHWICSHIWLSLRWVVECIYW